MFDTGMTFYPASLNLHTEFWHICISSQNQENHTVATISQTRGVQGQQCSTGDRSSALRKKTVKKVHTSHVGEVTPQGAGSPPGITGTAEQ